MTDCPRRPQPTRLVSIAPTGQLATFDSCGHVFNLNSENLEERIKQLEKHGINTDIERAALVEMKRQQTQGLHHHDNR